MKWKIEQKILIDREVDIFCNDNNQFLMRIQCWILIASCLITDLRKMIKYCHFCDFYWLNVTVTTVEQ